MRICKFPNGKLELERFQFAISFPLCHSHSVTVMPCCNYDSDLKTYYALVIIFMPMFELGTGKRQVDTLECQWSWCFQVKCLGSEISLV